MVLRAYTSSCVQYVHFLVGPVLSVASVGFALALTIIFNYFVYLRLYTKLTHID